MKKTWLLALAALLMLALLAGGASAEENVTLDGVVYTLYDDGTAAVVNYTEDIPKEVIIPSSVQGHTVTAVAVGALYGMDDMAIRLPDTITIAEIGDFAFDDGYNVLVDTNWSEEDAIAFAMEREGVNVSFAAEAGSDYKLSVRAGWADEGEEVPLYYGLSRYYGSAANLTLPAEIGGREIKEIDPFFAAGNTVIQNLVIPESYWSSGAYSFAGCTALKAVDMSACRIDFHANYMFQNCTALEVVTLNIPWEGGPCLGNYMFDGCTSLKKVTFPYGLVEYDGEYYEGCWAEWGYYTFRNCTSLETIEIDPNMDVRWLQEGVFQNCAKLSYLPCSVLMDLDENVDVHPFAGCESLTLGVFHGSAMEAYAIKSETPYEYMDSVSDEGLYYSLNSLTNEIAILSVAEDVGSEITVPDTIDGYPVKHLGRKAFEGQTGITGVVLPNSIETIGYCCFKDCTGLVSINIPENIRYLDDYVFENCTSLESIYFPDGTAALGHGTFYGCSSLSSVRLSADESSLPDEVFAYCTSLRELYLPDGIEWIGYGIFEGCDNPTIYVTEGSLTQQTCDEYGIEYVLYERGEETILQDGVFYTLKGDGTAVVTGYSAAIPDDVAIPENLEYAATGQAYTVTSIAEGAFAGCENLHTLRLPASMTSIGEGAFEDCYLYLLDTQWTEEEAYAFSKENKIERVGFAAEAGSAYKLAVGEAYSENEEEELREYCLVEYLGSAADLTLPEKINGSNVNQIAPGFARGNDTIQHLVIPKIYWDCGKSAFEGCTALKTVDLSECEILFYPDRMFAGCTALEQVIMNGPAEGAPDMGDYMFDGCTSLKKVSFPFNHYEYEGDDYYSNWCDWGEFTFRNCISLETIELDPAMFVNYLEDGVFQNCRSLKYLACYHDMYVNGQRVMPFEGCESLTLGVFHGSPMEAHAIEQDIPYEYIDELSEDGFYYQIDPLKGVAIIAGISGQLTGDITLPAMIDGYPVDELGDELFKGQTGITSITMPDTITRIGYQCFYGCSSLTTVRLPVRLDYMDSGLFQDCVSLRELYLPDNLFWIDYGAFEGCSEDLILYVTEGSLTQQACDEAGFSYVLYNRPGIAVDFEKAHLRLGDVFRVFVHYNGSQTWLDEESLSCVSSNPDAVRVDEDSLIFTAVGEGEAALTFTTKQGEAYTARCTITVGKPVMKFPAAVSHVEAEAFMDDDSLYILDFSDVKNHLSIDEYAFMGCDNLTTVYLPSAGFGIFDAFEEDVVFIGGGNDGPIALVKSEE